MRRWLAWLLTVPLMLVGSFAGHALGYRVAVSDPHAREHALAATGHGYLAYAPLAAGTAVALILVAFVALVVSSARGRRAPIPAGVFAALPPLAFVVQEHLERFVHHHGGVPWTAALEPPFAAGLLLQLPFALAALLVARLLVRVAVQLGRALESDGALRVSGSAPALLTPDVVTLPPLPALARGSSERGPPFRS